jgi:hypothetical protein
MRGLMKSAMELEGRGVIREVGMINAVTVGAAQQGLCDDATVRRCLEEGREGGALLIVEDVDLATWDSEENDGGGGAEGGGGGRGNWRELLGLMGQRRDVGAGMCIVASCRSKSCLPPRAERYAVVLEASPLDPAARGRIVANLSGGEGRAPTQGGGDAHGCIARDIERRVRAGAMGGGGWEGGGDAPIPLLTDGGWGGARPEIEWGLVPGYASLKQRLVSSRFLSFVPMLFQPHKCA